MDSSDRPEREDELFELAISDAVQNALKWKDNGFIDHDAGTQFVPPPTAQF